MANYDVTNSRMERFDRENPEFWGLFVDFTRALISAGMTKYSARAVFDRIRWHYSERGRKFHASNELTVLYARRFHAAFPHHDGFFRTRATKLLPA